MCPICASYFVERCEETIAFVNIFYLRLEALELEEFVAEGSWNHMVLAIEEHEVQLRII